MAKAKADWGVWCFVAFIVAIFAAIGMAVVVFFFGGVSGEEFSAQTFEYHSYSFYEIPGLRWQMSSVRYTPEDLPTLKKLLKEPYFPQPNKDTVRWDLIRGSRVFRSATGDAQILWSYIGTMDHKGNYPWEEWSIDNPKLAAIFWPVVIEKCREGSYSKLPDLFAIAEESKTPEELASKLGVPVPPDPSPEESKEKKKNDAAAPPTDANIEGSKKEEPEAENAAKPNADDTKPESEEGNNSDEKSAAE